MVCGRSNVYCGTPSSVAGAHAWVPAPTPSDPNFPRKTLELVFEFTFETIPFGAKVTMVVCRMSPEFPTTGEFP